jgi:hypothetical protein
MSRLARSTVGYLPVTRSILVRTGLVVRRGLDLQPWSLQRIACSAKDLPDAELVMTGVQRAYGGDRLVRLTALEDRYDPTRFPPQPQHPANRAGSRLGHGEGLPAFDSPRR